MCQIQEKAQKLVEDLNHGNSSDATTWGNYPDAIASSGIRRIEWNMHDLLALCTRKSH